MQLSKRLMTIVHSVTPGYAALDVGCDHAYAAVYLVQSGISPRAVASDIREGPLKAALGHIEEAGLGGQIAVVRADGIPADYRSFTGELPVSLILAGMGGRLMTEILQAGETRGLLTEEIVASPQRDAGVLRRWLTAHRYEILAESFLEDEGKFYTVMRGVRREEELPELTETEAEYGPVLLREGNSLYLGYLRAKENGIRSILGQIDGTSERGNTRQRELADELRVLGEALVRLEVTNGSQIEWTD